MSSRTISAAVARIAACRDAIDKRVPLDYEEAARLDALVESSNDILTLLAGVDDLGTIEEFHAAIESALGSPDPILEPTRADIERHAAAAEDRADAIREERAIRKREEGK